MRDKTYLTGITILVLIGINIGQRVDTSKRVKSYYNLKESGEPASGILAGHWKSYDGENMYVYRYIVDECPYFSYFYSRDSVYAGTGDTISIRYNPAEPSLSVVDDRNINDIPATYQLYRERDVYLPVSPYSLE